MPPNPFENTEYIEEFIQELQGIRMAVETSAELVPKKLAEMNKELAQFYGQGYSNVASRPPEQTHRETMGASSGASAGAISQTDLMRALSAIAQQTSMVPIRRLDERERESGGYRSAAPPGQRPILEQAKNWEELVTPSHMQRSYLEIPRSQGGHFTASDLFNYLSDTVLSSAGKRKQQYSQRAQDLQNLFDQTPYGTDESFDIIDQMQQNEAQGQGAGDRLGAAGAVLQRAGHEWVPQFALARQYLNRIGVNVSPGSLAATGAQLGVSPGQGFGSSVTIPGTDIGFRVPFLNPAARAAAAREFDIQKMRFSAGINGQQARSIFDMLNEAGYMPQSDIGPQLQFGKLNAHSLDAFGQNMSPRPQFGAMADALKQVTKFNPALLNQQTMEFMDRSVRTGSASLGDFLKVMKSVPDAAHAAGVSMQQMQADMNAAGDAAQGMGGTYFQGGRAATQFAGLTKMPGALLAPLMQNPLVQTMGVQKYGLMPWEQGAMNGYQWASTIAGSLGQTFNALGPMPDKSINVGNGFIEHISGRQRKEQLMSQLYGIDYKQIDNLLHEQRTVQARSKLGTAAEAWSEAVSRARGNPAELQKLFGHGAGHYGALTHLMNQAGFSDKEQAQVYNVDKGMLGKKLSGLDAQQFATDRYNKIQEIIRKKGNLLPNDPNQNVIGIIKLDDKAKKKGFHLESKRNAQAGVLPVNSPYANGPSQEPGGTMDPNTGLFPQK